MREAVVVSAVRTAVGKAPKGTLKNTRPDEMGAAVIEEAVRRAGGLEKSQVEDVLMGCAMPEAEQGMNVARAAAARRCDCKAKASCSSRETSYLRATFSVASPMLR